jgi:hypothetical protein
MGLLPVMWECGVTPGSLGAASMPHGGGARRGHHLSTARSLPEHPPAAYPLDGCTSRELGDLVGGRTRALELTLDLSPPPPQPA